MLRLLLTSLTALFLSACQSYPPSLTSERGETPSPRIKNTILLIGDGMGPAQFGLLETYARRAPNSLYGDRPTAVSQLMQRGETLLSDTGPHNALVVDSACSATQLAIGEAAGSEMIGLNARGDHVETVLQQAKRLGKATGLVSDTRITHATPASFAAHQTHRRFENEIAVDLLTSGVDVMLSGGLRYFLPQNPDLISAEQQQRISAAHLPLNSKRTDSRNLLTEAQQQGYQLAFNRKQLQSVQQMPLLGLFASSAMPDALAEKSMVSRSQPSLKEMTEAALNLLSQQEQGFFLMIEGGQIDWAGHNNDAGSLLHELLRFDEAIQVVVDWAAQRNDTLVILTADHETGGFGFSYSAANIPAPETLPGQAFSGQEFAPNFNFADLSLLDRLYNQKQSFYTLWAEAVRHGKNDKPTPASLMNAVNGAMDFTITEEQAQRILRRSPNRFYHKGHSYLGAEDFPHVEDFAAFYVYGDEVHLNLLARELATQQSVVWSTGTHTASPVPVIISGPDAAKAEFNGFMNHVRVGAAIKMLQ